VCQKEGGRRSAPLAGRGGHPLIFS
jgi:hypothetical protein